MTHCMAVRVYYEDTDSGGIVYHANYLKFAERARTEFLRAMGITQDSLRRDRGIGFVVRALDVTYLAPARMDDLLDVCTTLEELRRADFRMKQTIFRHNDALCVIGAHVVCVGESLRPVRVPEDVFSRFEDYFAAQEAGLP